MINYDFSCRTVLVTGAATGMGFEESRLLARSGAEVWMADIREDALNQACRTIAQENGKVRSLHLDVASANSWQQATAAIGEASTRLDGLVNNAGRSLRKPLLDTSDNDWRSVMNVNLDSVFYGMKYCHPLLRASQSAAIVNVSSITGLMGYFAPAYGTSKWGVRGLSQSAALELAGEGIRVNSIHPGLVESPLLNSGSQSFVQESVKGVPLDRVAQPEEIAQVVAFLLDPASSYVTGAEIVIDGGFSTGGIYKQITDRLEQL